MHGLGGGLRTVRILGVPGAAVRTRPARGEGLLLLQDVVSARGGAELGRGPAEGVPLRHLLVQHLVEGVVDAPHRRPDVHLHLE